MDLRTRPAERLVVNPVRRRRLLITVGAVAMLAVVLAGCFELPEPRPAPTPGNDYTDDEHLERVDRYLGALMDQDFEAALEVACSVDPHRVDAASFLAHHRSQAVAIESYELRQYRDGPGGSGGGRAGSGLGGSLPAAVRAEVVLVDGTQERAIFLRPSGGVCDVAAPDDAIRDAVRPRFEDDR